MLREQSRVRDWSRSWGISTLSGKTFLVSVRHSNCLRLKQLLKDFLDCQVNPLSNVWRIVRTFARHCRIRKRHDLPSGLSILSRRVYTLREIYEHCRWFASVQGVITNVVWRSTLFQSHSAIEPLFQSHLAIEFLFRKRRNLVRYQRTDSNSLR